MACVVPLVTCSRIQVQRNYFREWSLTMRGSYEKAGDEVVGGGQVKFYPHKKGGGKRFIHTKGGYTNLLDS